MTSSCLLFHKTLSHAVLNLFHYISNIIETDLTTENLTFSLRVDIIIVIIIIVNINF